MDGGDGRRGEGAGVARRWRVDGVQGGAAPPDAIDATGVTYLPQGVGLTTTVLVAGHRGAGFSRGRRRVRDGKAPGHRRQRRGPPRLRRGGLDAAAFIKNLLRGARAARAAASVGGNAEKSSSSTGGGGAGFCGLSNGAAFTPFAAQHLLRWPFL